MKKTTYVYWLGEFVGMVIFGLPVFFKWNLQIFQSQVIMIIGGLLAIFSAFKIMILKLQNGQY